MKKESKRRLSDLYLRLTEMESAEERQALLARVRDESSALARELEALLGQTVNESFLEEPAMHLDEVEDADQGSLRVIGAYRLLQKIGEGGMGVVYMAEQSIPVRRQVALKVIKRGMDTDQVVARFEAERQALSMMNHPNIARIFDGGVTDDGRPYFVMELVRGLPITEFCDEMKLSTAERLGLFVKVCGAVHHAHQKGIIHRDLKPSNILVTVNDDHSVPKVIDFGIAKATHFRLTEKTLFTRMEQAIGTPNFMSPEQVGLSSVDVDTRSDIYSLGALLYVLLTGENPFELGQTSWEEIRRLIREKDPSKPSTKLAGLDAESRSRAAERRRSMPVRLTSELKGDLDWIVMKAMEKDRNRRYDSAPELMADLERHLRHQPVQARPPSVFYRLGKAWRRHRVAWSAAALLMMTSSIGLWNAWDARQARRAEAEQRNRAQENERRVALEAQRAAEKEQLSKRRLYQADMNRVAEAFRTGKPEWIEPILVSHWPKPEQNDDFRGFEWYYWWRAAHRSQSVLQLPVGSGHATYLAHALSEGQVVFATSNPDVFVRSADNLHSALHGMKHSAGSYPEYSPDGSCLVVEDAFSRGRFNVLDTKNWTVVHEGGHLEGGGNLRFSFSGDSAVLAVAGEGNQIRLWNTASWEPRQIAYEAASAIGCLALSQSGEYLVAGLEDGRLVVWQTTDGAAAKTISVHQAAVDSIARSPDGSRFASADRSGRLHLWSDEMLPLATDDLKQPINALEFSSDGRQLLAACGGLPSVQIWSIDPSGHSLRRYAQFQGRSVPTVQAAFMESDQSVLLLDEDGAVSVWALGGEHIVQKIPSGENRRSIGFTQNRGRLMVKFVEGNQIRRWRLDAETFAPPIALSDQPLEIVLAEDSDIAGGIASDHSLGIWDATTGRRLHRGPFLDRDAIVLAASGTPRGVVYRDEQFKMRLWLPHPERVMEFRLSTRPQPVFLPSGPYLYAQQWIHDISGPDAYGVHSVQDASSYAPEPMETAASASGNWFATGIAEGRIKLRDTRSWEVRQVLRGHLGGIKALAFSPDDSRLASASDDQSVRFWDLQDGTLLGTISTSPTTIKELEFSPRGDALVALDAQGEVLLWEVPSEAEVRQDAALWLSVAAAELKAGKREMAQQLYEAGVSELPDHPDLLRVVAEFYLNENEWADSIEKFTRLFELVAPSAKQYLQRAGALARLGRGEEAMRDVLAALGTGQKRLPMRFFHDVRGVLSLGHPKDADQDFENVIQHAMTSRPTDAQMFAELGAHFQIDARDYDPARSAAFNLQAIELNPHEPRPWAPAGWMLLLAENFDAHRDLCRRFVDQFADSPNQGIHDQIVETCLLGRVAVEDPVVRAVVEEYAEAELKAIYNEPKVFQALASYRLQDFERAHKILTPILVQQKNTSKRAQGMARAVMAMVEQQLGNLSEAARWLRDAEERLPLGVSRTGLWVRWFLLVREAQATVEVE